MTRLPAATAPSTSPAPSMRPTSTCAAIATASSTSAMKMKMPKAIWCAASDGSPTRARTALAVRNAMSSDAERRKSSQEIRTSGLMSSGAGRRSTPGPPRAQEQHGERAAHPDLRDDGAGRRAVEPPVEPVDEEDLQHRVRELGGGDDDERRPQVPDPAQMPLPGEGDEREREPQGGDAQVALRERAGLAAPADEMDHRAREGDAEDRDRQADRQREPERLRRELPGALLLPGAVQPRDLGGRPVGEEDAQPGERREHRRGERQRGELRRAEVPDDGGVDEEIQRLGRQRPEGGGREAQDLPVQRAAAHAAKIRCVDAPQVAAAGLRRGGVARRMRRRGRGALLGLHRPRAGRARPRAGAGRGDARRRREPVVLPAGRHDARAPAGPRRSTFTAVAENLETQADDDPAAARRLGYLIGAARRGIEGSSGTSAELTHRLERTRRGGRRPRVRRRAARGPAGGGASG